MDTLLRNRGGLATSTSPYAHNGSRQFVLQSEHVQHAATQHTATLHPGAQASSPPPSAAMETPMGAAASEGDVPAACTGAGEAADCSLYVDWVGVEPGDPTRCNRLPLRRIDSIDAVAGVSKSLLQRAFPDDADIPEHLTSPDFYRFTPRDEFLSMPPDTDCTTFRLSLTSADGWEYAVCRRRLGGSGDDRAVDEAASGGGGAADQRSHNGCADALLVTTIQFESTAMLYEGLGLRVSLVAYPVIAIRKCFLDNAAYSVVHDPAYRGIL